MPLSDEMIAKMDAALMPQRGMSDEKMMAMDAALGLQTAPVQMGFGERVAEDFQRRQQIVRSKRAEGKPFITGSKAVGQAAMFGGDIVGEGMTSAFRALPPWIEDPIRRGAAKTIETVAPIVQPVIEPIAEKYGQFKQAHPDIASVGEDVAAGAMFLTGAKPTIQTGIKATQLATGGVKRTAQGAQRTGQAIAATKGKFSVEGRRLRKREELKTLAAKSGEGHEMAKISIEPLSNTMNDNLRTRLQSLTPKSDLGKKNWAGSKGEALQSKLLASLDVESPSFNDLLDTRIDLNGELSAAWRAGKTHEAKKLEAVKDKLDEAMEAADADGTWGKANHEWSQYATMSNIEILVAKTAKKAQPANSLDTSLVSYLMGNKSKGLRPNERDLLWAVVDNTVIEDLVKSGASGLTKYLTAAVGTSVGGLLGTGSGYLAGHFASEFLKDFAMRSKLNKLDRFYEAVEGREFKMPDAQKQLTYNPLPETVYPKVPKGSPTEGLGQPQVRPDTKSAIPPVREGQVPPRQIADMRKNKADFVSAECGVTRTSSKAEKSLGYSLDVERTLTKNKARIEKLKDKSQVFDTLEASQQAEVLNQIDKMWKNQPKRSLASVIEEAAVRLNQLAAETGGQVRRGSLGDLLVGAKKKVGQHMKDEGRSAGINFNKGQLPAKVDTVAIEQLKNINKMSKGSRKHFQKEILELEKRIKTSGVKQIVLPVTLKKTKGDYSQSVGKIADSIDQLGGEAIDASVDVSRMSESTYLTLSNTKTGDTIKIRISEHADRYGGNDFSITPDANDLYNILDNQLKKWGVSNYKDIFPKTYSRNQ